MRCNNFGLSYYKLNYVLWYLCFFWARQEIGVMVQFHDLYRFAVVFYSVCFVTILTALEHLGLDFLVINCVYD